MQQEKTYEIDRKTASQLLKVSTRTIDRYIRSGRLSARQVNGRIWLAKGDILDLRHGVDPMSAKTLMNNESIDNFGSSLTVRESAHNKRDIVQHQNQYHDIEFYKDLYEETVKALDERSQKLENAQYRMGQLEAQISNASQAHRFAAQNDDQRETAGRFQSSLLEYDKIISRLERKVEKERLNHTVFAWLLYGVLILQPVLWYLLRP